MKKEKCRGARAQLELPVFSDVAISQSKPQRDCKTVAFFTEEDKRRIKSMDSTSSKYAW